MTGFENYAREAGQIELEIERKGIALGIDWHDPAEVDELARAALDFRPDQMEFDPRDQEQRTRQELFGLAQLMLRVMEESAHEEIHTHGGEVWKIFGGALWRVWQSRKGISS